MGVQKAKNTESTLKVANASMNYPHAFSAAFSLLLFKEAICHCSDWPGSLLVLVSLFLTNGDRSGYIHATSKCWSWKKQSKRQLFHHPPNLPKKKKVDATISHGHYKKKHEKKTVQSSVLPQKKLPSLPSVQFWQQGFWTMVQAALSKVNPVLREDWTS